MSAKNWDTCPKCFAEHKQAIVKAEESLKQSYGKVATDEFLEQREAVEKMKVTPMEDTLREDWEIGVDATGKFSVRYSAECQSCDYGFRFKHEVQTRSTTHATSLP